MDPISKDVWVIVVILRVYETIWGKWFDVETILCEKGVVKYLSSEHFWIKLLWFYSKITLPVTNGML